MSEPAECQNFQDVISLDELKEGEIFPISLKGQPVVLLRCGNEVRALAGKCPHKGAPMEQGAYCQSDAYGEVLVCPWHKAVFSVKTGEVVEPIAFRPLPCYPVAVAEGRVLVGTVPMVPPVPVPRQEHETVLIVGTGAAGMSAAYTLRQGGFAGEITLIGEEPGLPYDRTALSKTVLVSEASRAFAPLMMDEEHFEACAFERVCGHVVHVDPASRFVELEDGQRLQGDHVIIASGSKARQPELPGIGLRGVLTLHSQRDAQYMAEAITPEQVVVLIGGGLIGLEVASSLRQKGVGVTVIASKAVPMEDQFGSEIGRRLLQLHEENSVAFISDARVAAIYGEGHVEGVELDDGTCLPCAHVLVAIGVEARSDFVSGVMEGPKGSILVDPGMRVLSDLYPGHFYPGVYAAGDVCAVERRGKIWQAEHWRHAQVQGRLAVQGILGKEAKEMPVPWFWTQQFGKKIEYLGWGETFDHVALTGSLRDFKFLATYTYKGRVVALAGAGHAAEMARAAVNFKSFVEEGIEYTPV